MKKIVSKQKEEDLKVDVTNDAEMVALGIRLPNLTPRDQSIWTKTDKEKALLKKAKHSYHGEFSSKWGFTKKPIPVYAKLIVTIKPSKSFMIKDSETGKNLYKTTFSHKCGQSDIPAILSKYVEEDRKLKVAYPLVVKYSWNGKTYGPKELPFWY